MSFRERSSSQNTIFSTKHSVRVFITNQFAIADDPHIPEFCLGPSLFDNVQTAPENSSSIASRSPPGSPHPEPLTSPQQVNRSPVDNTQLLINEPGETLQGTIGHSNVLQECSFSYTSDIYDTLDGSQNYNEQLKCFQHALSILPTADRTQSINEYVTVTGKVRNIRTENESAPVYIWNCNSIPKHLVQSESHEHTAKHIGIYGHARVDKQDESLPTKTTRDTVDTHDTRNDTYCPSRPL